MHGSGPYSNGRSGMNADSRYGQQFGQQYQGNSLRLVDKAQAVPGERRASFDEAHLPNAASTLEDPRKLVYLVTLSTLCLFAAPTVMAWHMGRDPDATYWFGSSYWFGNFGLYAGWVPIYILVVHFLHLSYLARDGRGRVMVLLAGLVPAIALLLIGLGYMWEARPYSIQLFSQDCDHPRLPWCAVGLQEAYEEARVSYDKCAKRLLKKHGEPAGLEVLPRRPILQNCEEWVDQACTSEERRTFVEWLFGWHMETTCEGKENWVPWRTYTLWPGRTNSIWRPLETSKKDAEQSMKITNWWYLASMEANHDCSGFCAGAPPLWTSQPAEIAGTQRCAPIVAGKLNQLRRQGAVIFVASLAGLLVFGFMYVAAEPMFRVAGYQ